MCALQPSQTWGGGGPGLPWPVVCKQHPFKEDAGSSPKSDSVTRTPTLIETLDSPCIGEAPLPTRLLKHSPPRAQTADPTILRPRPQPRSQTLGLENTTPKQTLCTRAWEQHGFVERSHWNDNDATREALTPSMCLLSDGIPALVSDALRLQPENPHLCCRTRKKTSTPCLSGRPVRGHQHTA